ncbi:polymer-forming cytoskeletal protein [Enterobacteriaceae bacterium LUAb1]
MDRNYLFFYTGLSLWLLTLAVWLFFTPQWALVSGCLAVGSFLFHGLKQQVFDMFGKNKTLTEKSPGKVATVIPPPAEKSLAAEEKPNNTIISSEVRFEGNITASGQVYIYGEVYGNIDAVNGMVKVMRNGLVKGNITSRELIIDGVVNGECKSETIDIDIHGNVNGALMYAALSVKKGGVFVGRAEAFTKTEKETNIVGFTPEKTSQSQEKNRTRSQEIQPEKPKERKEVVGRVK